MVKKIFKKVMPLVMATTMALSMSISFAENGNYTEPTVTDNANITVYKHVLMNEKANVPDETFNFTLRAAQEDEIEDYIKVGIIEGVTTSYSTIFTKDVVKDTAEQVAEYPGIKDKVNTGLKSATKSFNIDFSNVDFKEPGVYRYVLEENKGSNLGMTYDEITRYVDVYVQNNQNLNGLVVESVIMHKDGESGYIYGLDNDTDTNKDREGKNEGFVNELTTYDLYLEKILKGNQADMNKSFVFTIEIDTSELNGVAKDATYELEVESGTVEISNIVMSNGKGSTTVSLGNEDKIVVKDLPKGAKVKITEVNGLYTASYTVDGDTQTSIVNLIIDDNMSVVVTNTLEGTIPTGVFLAVSPMLAVVVIGVMGMMLVKRNHKEEEED